MESPESPSGISSDLNLQGKGNVIMDNIKTTKLQQMPVGYKITNNLPYGYIINPDNPDQLMVDETTAIYVEFIFDEFFRGANTNEISNRLTNINAPSSHTWKHRQKIKGFMDGKTIDYWSSSTLRKLLRHEIYTGQLSCMRRVRSPLDAEFATRNASVYPETAMDAPHKLLDHHHRAFITMEQHNKIMEMTAVSTTPSGAERKRKMLPSGIFQKRIYCARCNRSLRHSDPRNKPYESNGYYVCSSQFYKVPNPCPPNKHYIKDLLPEVKKQLISEHLLAQAIKEKQLMGLGCPDYKECDELFRNATDRLVSLIYKANPSDAHYEELRAYLSQLLEERKTIQQAYTRKNPWVELFSHLPEEFDLTKQVATRFIGRILVDYDGTMKVEFKKSEFKAALLPSLDKEHVTQIIADIEADVELLLSTQSASS